MTEDSHSEGQKAGFDATIAFLGWYFGFLERMYV